MPGPWVSSSGYTCPLLIEQNNAAAAPASTTSSSSTASSAAAPASASQASASAGSGGGSGGGGISANVGGVLSLTVGACGWCDSSPESPNGSEAWLNCNVNNGGWQPPMLTINEVVYAKLDDSGPFAICGPYIDTFNQVGQQLGRAYSLNYHCPKLISAVPPILLAAIALQESTCNAGATGRNGEEGLMQITPANCNRLGYGYHG